MDEIKQYWQQLNTRERVMIGIAGVAIGIMFLYLVILEPIMKDAQRLEKQLVEQQRLLSWMEDAAKEAKSLSARGGQKIKVGTGGQSLLGVIDRTAKAGQLGDAMKRVEPDGSNRVRVWLEKASFDDTVRWLERLEREYSMDIDSVVIDKEDAPGRVNVRLVFKGATS
jgi:general secretion pathway protein M